MFRNTTEGLHYIYVRLNTLGPCP